MTLTPDRLQDLPFMPDSVVVILDGGEAPGDFGWLREIPATARVISVADSDGLLPRDGEDDFARAVYFVAAAEGGEGDFGAFVRERVDEPISPLKRVANFRNGVFSQVLILLCQKILVLKLLIMQQKCQHYLHFFFRLTAHLIPPPSLKKFSESEPTLVEGLSAQ